MSRTRAMDLQHHNFLKQLSACSVTASYKPPMLVTRVRLPACAYLFDRASKPYQTPDFQLRDWLTMLIGMHART